MADDDFKGERGDDGRLLAEGWHGFACTHCSCYHIELLDRENKVFAAMVIDGDDLVEMAHVLLAFAAQLAMEEVYNGTTH